MKIMDILWGVLLTIMVYAIMVTLLYEVITNEDMSLSLIIGSVSAVIIRFLMAKLLNNIEADFNIIREGVTVVILIIITKLIYG